MDSGILLREAGRLINRTVTFRTITRSRHSRTGFTAFLLHLSTTTELLVINLVPMERSIFSSSTGSIHQGKKNDSVELK